MADEQDKSEELPSDDKPDIEEFYDSLSKQESETLLGDDGCVGSGGGVQAWVMEQVSNDLCLRRIRKEQRSGEQVLHPGRFKRRVLATLANITGTKRITGRAISRLLLLAECSLLDLLKISKTATLLQHTDCALVSSRRTSH